MKGYATNIEQVTLENTDYRRVLYTAKHSQLVVMSLKPGEEIGNEVHQLDQFIRVEAGEAKGMLNNGEQTYQLSDGSAIIVPAGVWHNLVNIGDDDLKLYTVYSPPEHRDGVVQATKAAEQEEHFDGTTTEN
jgi:mannose-6-phosphate isomerase-like protein (cupin superfamily)